MALATSLMCLALSFLDGGGSATLLDARDFGAVPDTGADSLPALRLALEAARAAGPGAVLALQPGRYDLYPTHAERVCYHVSNTASESEVADPVKTIGLHLRGFHGLTIAGNGALLVFHGRMTPVVIDHASDIVLDSLAIDFARPTMSELTIAEAGGLEAIVRVHPDSWYEVEAGQIVWVGEGWRHAGGIAQEYDPKTRRTWRRDNPLGSLEAVEELAHGLLRLRFRSDPRLASGHTLQVRDPIRDQVGSFVNRSARVLWRGCGFHYLHGLGVVSQFSEDVALEDCTFAPRTGSGRTCAGFADFAHFSGCRGEVRVERCLFSGSQDDPINVHGTHLRIVGRPGPDSLRVRYMHPQTYGFAPALAGDEIEIVDPLSLRAVAASRVAGVQEESPREWTLHLEQPLPAELPAEACVENTTWCPDVAIRDCRFEGTPTRGVLVTTRGRVSIERNAFEGTGMSAILIADDARSWFESGPVRDVTIRGNRFVGCAEPVISLEPEAGTVDAGLPVHTGVHVEGNEFVLTSGTALAARATGGLRFERNRVSCPSGMASPLIWLESCSDVTAIGNALGEGSAGARVVLSNTAVDTVRIQPDLAR